MERSCELLRDAGVAVKTIGYELGFKTSSHFTVCFKRQTGLTPQEYRRRVLLETI
jgi:two-component system response regulator YesN